MVSGKKFFLVDFENVHNQFAKIASDETAHFLVFVGTNQTKINFDIVEMMQNMGGRARYIKVDACAKNALDFYIAYYIGKLSVEYSGSDFHIVSKDKGYDPLVHHLRKQGIKCKRIEPGLQPVGRTQKPAHPEEMMDKVLLVRQRLAKSKEKRCLPASYKTLCSYIKSGFQNKITDKEVTNVIFFLMDNDGISIEGEKITYKDCIT